MKYYCYNNYTNDKYMMRCQILYLYEVEGLARREIAEVTGLSPATISSYRSKYSDLIEDAMELFTSTAPKKTYDIDADYSNQRFANSKDTNKFYLLRITKKDTNELILSKIGTTTRPINTRVKEILKDYEEKYGNIVIEIKRVYDCEKISPIAFESYFRFEYILRYGEHFVENDRFMEIDFDYKDADKIFNQLLKRMENALV